MNGSSSVPLVLAALTVFAWSRPTSASEPPPRLELVAQVKGMSCGGCAKRLSSVLARVEHVHGAAVDHVSGTVSMECDARVERAAIRKAIEDAGFEVMSLRRAAPSDPKPGGSR